ncbi:MAG TPA: class I SAM-dependent methyltransferase [Ornithinibacter sp.]|nr:class I SAM-dependent methyltransferase [Ornithinibacter sp.]
MQHHEISHHAHAHHPVMAPLSDASVARLLDRLLPSSGRLLDLGCGQGEWIRRALSVRHGVTAVGVDLHVGSDAGALAPGQASRAVFVEADAAAWTGGLFDAVLAVGVSHVFGGPGETLDAVRRHLAPGGRVLLGDGIWDVPPTPASARSRPGRRVPGCRHAVASGPCAWPSASSRLSSSSSSPLPWAGTSTPAPCSRRERGTRRTTPAP